MEFEIMMKGVSFIISCLQGLLHSKMTIAIVKRILKFASLFYFLPMLMERITPLVPEAKVFFKYKNITSKL